MASHNSKVGELAIAAAGVQVTTGAASATQTIPNTSSGVQAKYIFVAALSGAAYVKVGQAGLTCTVNDIPIVASQGLILNVMGMTTLAYLQESAAVKLNIIPLEVG
jgi:hypothetical protein